MDDLLRFNDTVRRAPAVEAWFAGGDFEAMHHERGPVSRVYATVLTPGSVAVGDAVVLEP